jgi:hypothetical protein
VSESSSPSEFVCPTSNRGKLQLLCPRVVQERYLPVIRSPRPAAGHQIGDGADVEYGSGLQDSNL